MNTNRQSTANYESELHDAINNSRAAIARVLEHIEASSAPTAIEQALASVSTATHTLRQALFLSRVVQLRGNRKGGE